MHRRIRWFLYRTRRIRRFVARTGPGRWIGAAGCALAAGTVLYAYTWCYCTIAGDHGQGESVHFDLVPSSCVVLNAPEAWQTPDGEVRDRRRQVNSVQYRDIFDNYELRQSRTGSLVYIALRSKQATGYGGLPVATGIRNSTNHFAFEIRSSGENAGRRIAFQNIRLASQEEWDGADALGVSPLGEPATRSSSLSRPELPPIAPLSNGPKWSVRTLVWGGPKDGLLFDEKWYNPPTYASVVFYASGTLSGEVRVWACSNLWAFIRDASIHANAYLTMPMSEDQRKLLLCQIGPTPTKEVGASESADTDSTDH